MELSDISLGTDPEIFIFDKKSKMYIAPYELGFKGTKDKPFQTYFGAIQVDGLALEFNTHPSRFKFNFYDSIQGALDYINNELYIMNKERGSDLEIRFDPIANFEPTYFKDVVPQKDKILGCDPDFIITGKSSNNPTEISNQPFRTAAGHIHIGWSKDEPIAEGTMHFEDCLYVAQKFEEKRIFKPTTKEEHERLKYYGGNGAFRPKPYGVELRSPSNMWLKSKESIDKMYDSVMNVMQELIDEAA